MGFYFEQGIIGLPESDEDETDFPTYLDASEDSEFIYELKTDEREDINNSRDWRVYPHEWLSEN